VIHPAVTVPELPGGRAGGGGLAPGVLRLIPKNTTNQWTGVAMISLTRTRTRAPDSESRSDTVTGRAPPARVRGRPGVPPRPSR
jgi:hypothetical protein